MTRPTDQPDEPGRTGGGVRGAINDLLGRNDRTDDARTDDGRRAEDERLAQERATPGRDAAAGARFDGGADGTATPTPGTQFEGQHAEQHRGAGVVGAAAPEQHGAPAAGGTPGSARHTDVGPGGPGYPAPVAGTPDRHEAGAGPAGPRTVDIGRENSGSGVADPSATTDGATTRPGPSAASVAQTSQGEDSSGRERLVSADRAQSYGTRWDAVKGEFVDEPRRAVADADALVGELLDELQTLFTEQRKGIERSMAADETSTEDMRLALRRYRSFFDRLLSI